jgi:tRNA threonylcarbamoyladenosine biosynthesis protein TsaB
VKLLAVETCLGACSVALLQGATVLAHHHEAMQRGHAEALAPMVQTAMRGHDLASLDRLAVTVGPGTFTGQRVGLSFMRGLRLALNKPLVGLTSLEAIAAAAGEQKHSQKIAVIHDARRSEVYLALVDNNKMTMAPRVLALQEALAVIQDFGPCVLAGTGAAEVSQKLCGDFNLSDICQPDALFVARLAQALAPPDKVPAPLYLRAPDAKLPAPSVPVSPVAADGDVAALARVHAAAFDKPWDVTALKALLTLPGTFAFASPSGFVLARTAAGEAEILTLAVAPPARERGLGRALVKAAAARASQLGAGSMFLEVGTDNPAALSLYGRLGFVRVGERKRYYEGRDALVLKAALPLTTDLAYFATPVIFKDGL